MLSLSNLSYCIGGVGLVVLFSGTMTCFVVMPLDVTTVVFKRDNQNMIVQALLILK